MKTLTPAVCVVAGLLAAPCAYAQQKTQDHGGFVSVVFGSQTIPTLTTASEFDVFGRQGTIETTRRRTSAPLLDVAAAHRMFRRFAAGAAVVRTRTGQRVTFDARVPVSPTGFQIYPVSGVYRDAAHRETQLHFSALWIAPFNEKVEIDFSGGPSVLWVNHDSLTAMTMHELFFATPVVTKDSDTTVGYHAGFDLRALLIKNAGLGFGIRYTRATADLSTGKHQVGGLQIGAGLAVVF